MQGGAERLGDGDAPVASDDGLKADHLNPAEPDSFTEPGFFLARFSALPSFSELLLFRVMISTAPAIEITLPSVSFFGRTLAEYLQFFSLELPKLRGRAVLDVAAGPSSFVAEACRKGVDAVAVDPLYGCTEDALAQHVTLDYRAMFRQMRSKPQLFRFRSFASFEEAEASRRTAAERFLQDYGTHFVHGRYVGAALPLLPFLDGTFDLVLCAHFLFIYEQRFDFDFHLTACRELVRVSRQEARIHPLVGLGGKQYSSLARLRERLEEENIESEIVPVDYEFFAGSSSMLVLRRRVSTLRIS